jgi:hypothetical protein
MVVVFAAALVLMLLASFYWERSLTIEPTREIAFKADLREVKFLGYSDVLDKEDYEGTALGGLSGLTYDPDRDLYYAVADKGVGSTPARFYEIRLPVDLVGFSEDPTISDVTALVDSSGHQLTGEGFDAEGIAVTTDGQQQLLVASETRPSILRFSREGDFLAELPVPQRFLAEPEGEAQANATFESLSLSPDGERLFTANELPLASDGQDADKSNRLRLLEYENRESSSSSPPGFVPSREFFYLTNPREGPGQSVNDVAALSDRALLVLEDRRKVYRVLLGEGQEEEGEEDVSDEESLASSGVAPLDKELLVDLGKCPLPSGSENAPPGFEGLTVGPEQADGGRVLMLESDDNFTDEQKTVLAALEIRLPQDSSPLEGSGECE